jgi:hypothetical protein
MEMIGEILNVVLTVGILGGVVYALVRFLPQITAYLKTKANEVEAFRKTQIDDAIIDALSVSVSNVGESYVKDLVAKKEGDGKLTDEEKKEARSKAVGQASEILKAKGIELLKEYSDDAIAAIIRYIVDKTKAKAKKDE